MTDIHSEANASVPAKSPIERKPVGGIPPENTSVEPTLPQQPTQDIDEKTVEAVSCDTCSVPRKAASSRSKSPPSPIKIDKTQPEDFEGELATNNDLPSAATLKKIEKYIVLDRHGKSHPFKTLYTGSNVARRVLIIFVRHFFCGVCCNTPSRGCYKLLILSFLELPGISSLPVRSRNPRSSPAVASEHLYRRYRMR